MATTRRSSVAGDIQLDRLIKETLAISPDLDPIYLEKVIRKVMRIQVKDAAKGIHLIQITDTVYIAVYIPAKGKPNYMAVGKDEAATLIREQNASNPHNK